MNGPNPDASCADDQIFSVNPLTGKLKVRTTDKLNYPPGVYEFTIRAQGGTGDAIFADGSFFVELYDPCPDSTLTDGGSLPYIDVAYKLDEAPVSQTAMTDAFANLIVDDNNDCGPFRVEFTDKSGNPIDSEIFD